jgi:hypothetical protein
VKNCYRCGEPLRQISSVASNPHDEPVLACACWPVDWTTVAAQALVLGILVWIFSILWWVTS